MKQILIILTIFMFANNIVTSNESKIVKIKTCDDFIAKDTISLDTNFTFTYKAFKFYNPEIDTQSVNKFLEVCNFYGFNTDEKVFKYCLGQLLLESGGKHYKNGKINIGSGRYVGVAQISASSGLAVLTKRVNDSDFNDFKFLANDSTLIKPKTYSQSIKWLSDFDNNLILWGYMINYNLKMGSIEHALVRYNAGPGGYINYINSGNSVNNHHYIRGIKNKLSNIK